MKLKITIIGRVQDVGYRLFLLNHADSLLIKRFSARNVKIDGEQALIVLVEGIEKKVKEFLNIVKSQKPEKAVVEKIKVEEYKGEIGSIDSYRSSLMIEQLSKIVNIGLEMVGKQDKMLEKQDSMLGKQDEMLGKMDLMLEKQDETIKVIREESERTREHFGRKIDESKEYLAKKIDESKEHISRKIGESKEYMGEKIDSLRLDLRSYLDERLKKIEKEIEEIKARIGMS